MQSRLENLWNIFEAVNIIHNIYNPTPEGTREALREI